MLTFLVLALGSIAITRASLAYFDPDDLAPFVIEKLPLPLENVWLVLLKVHVAGAAFALPACLLLVGKTLLRKAPRVHRWLGRATGVVVLGALVPSGLYLSLFAKGGLPGTLGFMLSGAIVAAAMVRGIGAARSHDFVAHRRWALHVLAQLSVAVTSRAMLFLLDAVNADPVPSYLLSLWLPVVGSALVVELLSRPRSLRLPRRSHETFSRARDADVRSAGLRGTAGV